MKRVKSFKNQRGESLLLSICEKDLQRSQKCVIVATPNESEEK